ncbi:unnamed protein product [Arctia plantaginis]|uniref:MADF domain-containing protein n=1 Tax=Arctia plantaginis TaxID=874455 RepID=A0A8S1A7T2_ARCPL|nr:unnamed protein product [Arctia plantaginis]
MREFKYDVIQLITGIRDRPCLWDKTIENYKDRVERRIAWEEIFNMLEERYDNMTLEEKRLTGEHILNKWTNIRDTFVKSLKTKMGRPKRRYVLYEHLKFLTKINPEVCGIEQNELGNESNEEVPYLKQETESHLSELQETSYEPKKRSKRNDVNDTESNNFCVIENSYSQKRKSKRNDFDDLKLSEYCGSESSYSQRKKSKDTTFGKKKSKNESTSKDDDSVNDDINFVEVDESDNPRVMNEDEAFFASLLPTVVRYSEDERLEFRIEVLGVMKKIKDKRKWYEV